MPHVTGWRCLTCKQEQRTPSLPTIWRCPACGGNVELRYDLEAAREQFLRDPPARSRDRSLWRYAPLLPLHERASLPPLPVGDTPLLAPRRLREALALPHLHLKDDTRNPSASFKDRASAIALAHARELGARRICAASTGNAGSSLACLAASTGQPCTVFVPESAPRAKLAQLMAFGAQVAAVQGTYDDAFDLSLALSEKAGWYNRNTGTNPYTREGKKTCAFEIADQLGGEAPDCVLVPVGDGNIISGIWKGFRELHGAGLIRHLPRIYAVQSSASDAVTRAATRLRTAMGPEGSPDPAAAPPLDPRRIEIRPVEATTVADSISVDLPRDGVAAVRAVVESRGGAVTVDDDLILAAIGRLARTTGVFAEPAGAAPLAALPLLLQAEEIHHDERIVLLVTGNGLKDVQAALRATGSPTPVPRDDVDAVLEALAG